MAAMAIGYTPTPPKNVKEWADLPRNMDTLRALVKQVRDECAPDTPLDDARRAFSAMKHVIERYVFGGADIDTIRKQFSHVYDSVDAFVGEGYTAPITRGDHPPWLVLDTKRPAKGVVFDVFKPFTETVSVGTLSEMYKLLKAIYIHDEPLSEDTEFIYHESEDVYDMMHEALTMKMPTMDAFIVVLLQDDKPGEKIARETMVERLDNVFSNTNSAQMPLLVRATDAISIYLLLSSIGVHTLPWFDQSPELRARIMRTMHISSGLHTNLLPVIEDDWPSLEFESLKNNKKLYEHADTLYVSLMRWNATLWAAAPAIKSPLSRLLQEPDPMKWDMTELWPRDDDWFNDLTSLKRALWIRADRELREAQERGGDAWGTLDWIWHGLYQMLWLARNVPHVVDAFQATEGAEKYAMISVFVD